MKAAGRALGVAVALLPFFGCQSIANVEDVSFSATDSACTTYCSTLKKACPGDAEVYDDDETCLQVCALFKSGNPDKPQPGNTLACRAEQADLAESSSSDLAENKENCAAAGPGGTKKCTGYAELPDCEGYCTIYKVACPDTVNADFKNFDQCMRGCAAFPNRGSYTAAGGKTGDTLACRLNHATLAIADPDNNCTSSGFQPAGDCVGASDPDFDCGDYCGVNLAACTDQYQDYENRRQCLAVCEVTKKGDRVKDQGGQDTIACRTYHSYFALKDPSTHCTHAGPTGDAVCTDDAAHPNCGAFCNLFKNACATQFDKAYGGTVDACLEDCEKLEDAGEGMLYSVPAAKQGGDTLKCRTLYAVQALTDPLSADASGQCERALGGDPCN